MWCPKKPGPAQPLMPRSVGTVNLRVPDNKSLTLFRLVKRQLSPRPKCWRLSFLRYPSLLIVSLIAGNWVNIIESYRKRRAARRRMWLKGTRKDDSYWNGVFLHLGDAPRIMFR